ncbi:hypothetical protein [Deinococcus sp.]|uniref:hypothetical protein n=1 Tax=Deinococcus sp. TaxID=47478 RepID=UPI0025CDC86C|nr:hypothetical protein [Deinococcus sp.]
MKYRLCKQELPDSGRGYVLVCPGCGGEVRLHDLRGGDQGYWCERCQTGQRIGELTSEALRPVENEGVGRSP